MLLLLLLFGGRQDLGSYERLERGPGLASEDRRRNDNDNKNKPIPLIGP